MANKADVLKGTLDLMILKALSFGPDHGFGVAKWIHTTTAGALQIDDGALYPALHRLVARDWLRAEWGVSENNRKAKYYQLTPLGRRELRQELSAWQRFAVAMTKIVQAEPGMA